MFGIPRAVVAGELPFVPRVAQSAGEGRLPRAHATGATDCHVGL